MKPDMKRYVIFSMTAVVAMAFSSCIKDNIQTHPETDGKTHTVTLDTSAPDTKTGVVMVPGGYQATWSEGDYIHLAEYNTVKDDYVTPYESDPLQSSDIVNGKASFTVDLNTDEASEDKYQYLAFYGTYPWAYIGNWQSADDPGYTDWCNLFEYTGEYAEPHMLAELYFNEWQNPFPDSFDPNADVMVSKLIETTGQMKGAATLKFARLGTIVKITLTGLDAFKSKTLLRAEFVPGESFIKNMSIIYDPILEKYAHLEMNMPEGDFEDMPEKRSMLCIDPQETCVKEDGTADIWIRTYAGKLTDGFSLSLFIEDEEQGEIILKRTVDLEKEGKTIEFNEGGMTVFSVGNWDVADVDVVFCETVVNETMDGFTGTWEEVENAVGYDCYLTGWYGEWDENGKPEIQFDKTPLTPVDNGDGTWSVSIESGLEPMNYVLHIKPVPAEGHCLIYDDYETFEMKIGIPEEWWFAHDCFGSMESELIEGTDGEYIIDFSPGKVRFKNLSRSYDEAWQALKASGPWFMYSTEPLKKVHSIEVYSKNDSHLNFKVYASKAPNEHTMEIIGTVIETSEIDVGSGSHHYKAVHKRVRYTFPEDETYQYYTICGEEAGIVMTSQYTYVYYFK